MTHSIPRNREKELEYEAWVSGMRKEYRLCTEISRALTLAQQIRTQGFLKNLEYPQCEHDLRHCPICHRTPEYNPSWDIPAPAVQ
jgi:hypothetical protein